MRNHPLASSRAQRGFTLIELMVGMVIGLLSTMVVMQVMAVSEAQRRSTTTGADAQVAGALALYTLERDIRMAGYGISSTPHALGCTINPTYGGAVLPGFSPTLAPVTITQGVGGASDTIRLLASNKNDYSVPIRVMPPAYKPNDKWFSVASTLGVAQGDLMIAFRDEATPCELFQVTANPAAGVLTVPRADDAGWNRSGYPSVDMSEGAQLINLGSLADHTYSVAGATLRRASYDTASRSSTTADLQPGVVLMKVFYGRDAASSIVDLQDGKGRITHFDYTTPVSADDWQRVLAVRVVVVTRSGQFEKEAVTTSEPQWDVGTGTTVSGAVTCGSSKCLALNVGASTAEAEAQHYRYKVFDTVVPVINLLWRS